MQNVNALIAQIANSAAYKNAQYAAQRLKVLDVHVADNYTALAAHYGESDVDEVRERLWIDVDCYVAA